MNISSSVKRVLSTLLVLVVLTIAVIPDAQAAYGAVRSKKKWGKGVTDEKLNEMNGTHYYALLPGVNMYACVGYVEWALKNVYEVSPDVPSYPYVRNIRNFFVSKNTKMVGYGSYVSERYGGDGKYHIHGKIKPGDIIFFFKRGAVNGKVKMKALGNRKHANIQGTNLWTHIAILSGEGEGIDAKIHHSSTGNPGKAISMNSSIRTLLNRYDTVWGATDYQVFRVLTSGKGRVLFRLTYEKKSWYNRDPDLDGAEFVVKNQKKKIKLTTDEAGKTAKSEKVKAGKYLIKQVEAPDGFKTKDLYKKEVTIHSDKTKKIKVKVEPKLKFRTIVIKRKNPKKPQTITYRIWPRKYGKYRDDKNWWNSIPGGLKQTITLSGKKSVESKKLPAKCSVFNGIYYIHQISSTTDKYKPYVNKKIQLKKKGKNKPFKLVLKKRTKKTSETK